MTFVPLKFESNITKLDYLSIRNTFTEITLQNDTIEERVAVLEFQVTDLEEDIQSVEDEVTIISQQQILQDERILELELDSDGKLS